MSVGFEKRTLFVGVPFSPIQIAVNGYITNMTIAPPLLNGLVLDPSRRQIGGVYNGSEVEVTYLITAITPTMSLSSSFMLEFKQVGETLFAIDVCTYRLSYPISPLPTEWYATRPADHCNVMSELFIHDDAVSSAHMSVFTMSMLGYIYIPLSSNYSFFLNCTTGARVLLDGKPILSVFAPPTRASQVSQASQASQVSQVSQSIPLEEGIHFLQAYYTCAGQPSFALHYRNDHYATGWVLITASLLRQGGVSPQRLRAPPLLGCTHAALSSEPPSVSGAPCSAITITPPLPPDLAITADGQITGRLAEPFSSVFRLTCVGSLGSVAAELRVGVQAEPLQGVWVEYFAVRADHALCDAEEEREEEEELAVRAVETTINHPYQDARTVWPSLPQALFAHFVVHYTALLHVPVPGQYQFLLCYRDGVDFSVDSVALVRDWRCQTHFNCRYASISLNGTGFVPLSLRYFSSGDAFGLQLTVQAPAMPAVPAVPVTPTMPDTHDTHDTHDTPTARGFAPLSPLLFFTPPEPFVYTSSPTHYVLNHAIVPNLPVFFSSAAPAQFSALPALPAGLQLLNGAIRGTPREARAMMEYTVTAYDAASKTTLQATVRFDVVAVTPPSHILVTDEHGSPVTSLTVTMYAAVNLTLSADVPVFAWSVSSDLPEGLAFLPSQQRVVGHVLKKLASSTFWITCSNDGGSVSAPFSIHVVACNYDHLVYSTLNEGAVMEVQVQTEAGKVVINKVMDEPLYALVLCLPLMPYRLHALCKRAGTDCILHITREDDLILSSLVLLQGQKAEASLALNYSTAPVITTQTPIIYTQSDAAVNVWFTVENPFYKVVFQPALPPTLAFNQSTLLLSGTFATPGIFTYQLRAANEVGEGVLLVTVYVDHCPQNTSLVQLQRRSSLFGESLTILRGSEPLYHFRFQVGPYADMLCIPFGDFTVRMENEAGRGWVSGSDLIVTDDEDHLWGTFRLDPSQRVQEDVLHYALLASNATALRFLVTALAPVTAWLTPQFDDSAWALGAAGAWGTLPAGLATTYFRATVAMERDATFLQLSLFLKEGAIVYVDGAELARENLPAGQIYHATTASASFPTARWVAYSVEATHALERYTVVAVELHRQHVSSTAPISFAMNIHSHHVPSLLRSAAGNLTSSDAFNATHPVANAFDGCGYTAWDAPLPAWARLRYDDGEKRVVNRVDLRIADSRSWTAPSFVRLYGERGGRERLLGEWRGGLWFNAPHATVSLFAHNTAAFAAYRVEFPAVPGKEALQLTAVAFYQALVLECAAVDGWPAVAAGQTLFRECGKVAGFMARQCVRRGATAAWEQVDRSGCVSVTPSIGKVYLDAVLAVLNCTLAEWQEGVGEAVHRVMRRELRLRGEQVKLPSCAETVMQSTFAVRSLVRVEGEKSDKATLVEEWHRLLPEITRLVQEEMGELARGMAFAFEEEPLVRQCYTVLWIVLGCIAGLGVIVCVCAIAYRRWRQKHIVQFSKRTL